MSGARWAPRRVRSSTAPGHAYLGNARGGGGAVHLLGGGSQASVARAALGGGVCSSSALFCAPTAPRLRGRTLERVKQRLTNQREARDAGAADSANHRIQHSGFGDFISVKLGILGYTAFKRSSSACMALSGSEAISRTDCPGLTRGLMSLNSRKSEIGNRNSSLKRPRPGRCALEHYTFRR